MLDWLRKLLGPVKAGSARHRSRAVRFRYDAAQTTDDNRRHWAAADSLSARSANSPEVRRLLRNRSRYEVANNSYAKGIVLTLANDVVGTGPRLQLLTDDPEANRRIEQAFSTWARAVGLAEKLQTMRQARAVDGEAFGVLTNNPKIGPPVQLDLRLVETDQFHTPDLLVPTETAVDGIVFDTAGNPVEYHVLKNHPGDLIAGWSLDYSRLPASSVLHWFRCDRPGQARGVPEILPALPLFAQLRRFTLATIAAAETAADFAALLKTDAPADVDDPEGEPWETMEIEKRAMTTLPPGYDVTQLKAEHPTTTYREFKHEVLNEIARCLNMPFNVAAGNSSGYNYASGRLDHQTYYRSIKIDQSHCEAAVLDRILLAWLDEATHTPGLLPTGIGPFAAWPWQWFWPGQEHVDPLKEASAQAVRLAQHTTTLADEYARRGLDWESQIRQRAKEMELLRELGLPIDQAGQQAAMASAMNDPEEP